MKALSKATGIARMEVIKGDGRKQPPEVSTITDPDELRRLAQQRNIAFSPTVSVERMQKRLAES